jgi:adenylate cyclase
VGDNIRRIADSEAAWWKSEVIERIGPDATTSAELADRLSPVAEQALLAMYHAMQARAWTVNIIESSERMLEQAGLHSRLERPPAICFLDITGYTRLTQERGDDAALDVAATVARLVQRVSVRHGGKPIKWLGDGVMFYFPAPGSGVLAALEMVEGLADAGLPPAHVGLHAGPVIFQEGDYFGQTVNLTARIADYARPGEVLVSQAVVDASSGIGVAFLSIGDVELKGVAGTVPLSRAQVDPLSSPAPATGRFARTTPQTARADDERA